MAVGYFIATLLVLLAQDATSDFSVDVWPNGDYSVVVNDVPWLVSGPTHFQANGMHHSTADGTLKMLTEPGFGNGTDTFGTWSMVNYTWSLGSGGSVDTTVRKYNDVNVALFTQNFHKTVIKTAVGNKNGVISGFPTFKVGTSEEELGLVSYGGLFIGWYGMTFNKWTPGMPQLKDGLESGPLVFFDQLGNVIIVSPFNQFMAASVSHDRKGNTVNWGIMGGVDEIPAGFEYNTMIFYSSKGINKAMEEWGSLLRYWYKRSSAARQVDPSINYVGYYTDNGAYYRNFREPHMTYEQTISGIAGYAKQACIPYRYIQLDDWWYPITKNQGYGATITWTAMPSIFPDGLEYIYNITRWPVVAHNRYWSNITPYAKKNGGKFNFVISGDLSLPDDQSFWDYLFKEAKRWGLAVYEQDWCNYQVETFAPLHTDLTLGWRWLHQMGEAARRYDIQIQYCMALPRHLLASLEVPAVSQIRASTDYQLSADQWKIGVTSIFANALGVAPFKDNLWTRTSQPGNVYHKTEPNPLLQLTVALLSTGPVGVGDRIKYSNASLINRLINADGLLLKPSRPATAIDLQIIREVFNYPIGEVWTTHSKISGLFFGIIFCPLQKQDYIHIGPTAAGFEGSKESMAFNYKFDDHSVPLGFSDVSPLVLNGCSYNDFCLYYTTPIIIWRNNQLMILGEMSKMVPVSPNRISSIEISSNDVLITLKGKPTETVIFYMNYKSINIKFTCVLAGSGSATLSFANRNCQ